MNRELYNLSADDTKFLLLIYEMAKLGAITLDSSSSEHAQIMYDYMDYQCVSDDEYGRIDDFKENSVEPTEELLEAIRILNDAQDKDYTQKCYIEQMVKLSEYELQKIYFEVIKELTKEEHLSDMVVPMYVEKDLINKG